MHSYCGDSFGNAHPPSPSLKCGQVVRRFALFKETAVPHLGGEPCQGLRLPRVTQGSGPGRGTSGQERKKPLFPSLSGRAALNSAHFPH